MNQERLMKVLLGPVVSEKGTAAADKFRQFVFRVVSDATKPEIKSAVEHLFKVEVDQVRVCNVKGKLKRSRRGRLGRHSDWKKAYVSLKEGFDINFSGAE
jgi:large subunit ribosomal protein L23